MAILAKGTEPLITRRGLPGDPEDDQSRYIEAAINGVLIGCLYLPNGNPAPGPRFEYKQRWFRRLNEFATELLELDIPAMLVGDFNVMPTALDVYKPERWVDDALHLPEVRKQYADLLEQGWTDAIRLYIRMSKSTHSGNTGATASSAMPDYASTTSFYRLPLSLGSGVPLFGDRLEDGRARATMRLS